MSLHAHFPFLGRTLALAAAVLAPAAHANNVIILNSAEATLSLIDQQTREVVSTMPTGKEPHHLMATPDNSSLIVANSVSNSLMFLDPKTGKLQRTVEGSTILPARLRPTANGSRRPACGSTASTSMATTAAT